MHPTPEFEEGSIVYLKTDLEQQQRIVIGYTVRLNKVASYHLGCGSTESWHYSVEISKDKNSQANIAGFAKH